MRTSLEVLLLLALCGALFLPGGRAVPFYTKGEAREALVVREVLRTGQWLVPRRPGGELTRKPPLYYWAGAALTATIAADQPEQGARLPSALGASAGVLATWHVARVVFTPAAGLPSALVLATSFEWLRSATRARIDMTLAAPLTLLLLAWVVLARRRSPLASAGATACVALAILAKGPVGAVLPALAVAVTWPLHRRQLVLARFAIPLAVGTAIAGLWYLLAWHDLGQPFVDVVMRENLSRFVDAEAAEIGHAHGMLYLLGLGLAGLLPWTPLLPLVAAALARQKRPDLTLLAAWALMILIFFSVSSGKRDVYLLPMYPALAALIGGGMCGRIGPRIEGAARAVSCLYLPLLLVVAGILLAYGVGLDPARLIAGALSPSDAATAAALAASVQRAAIAVVALSIASAGVAFAVERLRRRSEWRPMSFVLTAYLVGFVAVFQSTLHPAMATTRSPARFLRAIEPRLPPGEPVYTFGPVNQLIRFYAPRPLRRFPRGGLTEPGLVVAWQRDVDWRRDSAGRRLQLLARSAPPHDRHGPLVLVRVPPGTLTRAHPPGGRRGAQKG